MTDYNDSWSGSDASDTNTNYMIETGKIQIPTIMPYDDHIEWLDYKYKWAGKIIDELEMEDFIRDTHRTLAFIEKGTDMAMRWNNKQWEYTTISTISKSLCFSIRKHTRKIKPFQWWYMRCPQYFPTYRTIVFEPLVIQPAQVFNIWSGFKAKSVPKESIRQDLIKPILNHIANVLTTNAPREEKDWFIQRIAHIIQEPNRKVASQIVLYSKQQQTGKSIFVNYLINSIIGHRHAAQVSGLDHITGRFNSILAEKILVGVDEVAVSHDQYQASFDKLKNICSESTIAVEKKGIDTFIISNKTNFIFCTNHHRAIVCHEGDSRFAFFEVSDRYRNNRTYFDKLSKTLDNPEAADHFYSYLLNLKITKDIRIPPLSKFKEELGNLFKPNTERFYEEFDIDEVNEYDRVEYKGQNYILVGSYYKLYEKYCQDEGEKALSARRLYSDLTDKIERKVIKIQGQPTKIILPIIQEVTGKENEKEA